jgi:L-amino acid N-acyltransferase YncA
LDLYIAPLSDADWLAVREIYRQGIDTGNATFETEAPTWAEWDSSHLAVGRIVAWAGCRVVGWAALSPVSGRAAYRGVAEVSIYVAESARRQGVGRLLLQALVEAAERAGLWTLQAGIFPENQASLALHRACGFRVVGRRERIGQRDNRWRDVILMERRSAVVN